MKQTRLYLDVDGVLNADLSGSPYHWEHSEKGKATAEGYAYNITWAPALIERLSALESVELVWTTTWRDDAAGSLADLIGWGHGARVLHPNRDPSARTAWPTIDWKARAVLAEQSEDPSPFIHIDDELFTQVPTSAVADYVKWVHMNGGLAIHPHPMYGITPKSMERIEDYVSKQNFLLNQNDEE